MKAEIIEHKDFKGRMRYYLKLIVNGKEHFQTISELNVQQIRELEKQQELPLKDAKK